MPGDVALRRFPSGRMAVITSGRIIRIIRTVSPRISSLPHLRNVSSMLNE